MDRSGNDEKVNILCLYWVGDFRGRDFTTRDVVRLRQSVDKHIDRPYTFYCLTNDMKADIPAVKILLNHNWPGWWSKVEVHRPDLPRGKTLYMDLDTHIVRSLKPILDFPAASLTMFNTRARKKGKKKKKNYSGMMVHRYQAATMWFTCSDPVMTGFYEQFCEDPQKHMKEYRSEQDLMGVWIPDQPVFPAEWMIKLPTLRTYPLPKDTIIVTGQPGKDSFREPEFAKWINTMAR